MKIQIDGREVLVDADSAIDISIPLRFNGPQPNAYGVASAVSKPVEAGDLVGDTRLGGSVNFEQYTLIPHCNGTHTECVGHITHERISVRDCLQDVFIPAAIVSVVPVRAGETADTYAVEIGEDDRLITRRLIESSLDALTYVWAADKALIIRTLPNDESKLTREYGAENIPPYFTTEAMQYIVESGFKHLLVDLPSIDRIFDNGKLLNHRIFWNVEPGAFELNANSRLHSTITELIYVPSEIEDGEYLLNLQVAPFESDATPSRPILFHVPRSESRL